MWWHYAWRTRSEKDQRAKVEDDEKARKARKPTYEAILEYEIHAGTREIVPGAVFANCGHSSEAHPAGGLSSSRSDVSKTQDEEKGLTKQAQSGAGSKRGEQCPDAEDAMKVVLVCATGIGSVNSAKRAKLSRAYFEKRNLADRLHVIYINYPGYGDTDKAPAWRSFWPWVINDLVAITKKAHEYYKKQGKSDMRFASFGLSMGGATCFELMAHPQLSHVNFAFAIRICGPVKFGDARVWGPLSFLSRGISYLFLWFLFPDYYLGDDLNRLERRVEHGRGLEMSKAPFPPVYMFHCTEDHMVDIRRTSMALWSYMEKYTPDYKRHCIFIEFPDKLGLVKKKLFKIFPYWTTPDMHRESRTYFLDPICDLITYRLNEPGDKPAPHPFIGTHQAKYTRQQYSEYMRTHHPGMGHMDPHELDKRLEEDKEKVDEAPGLNQPIVKEFRVD
ncbi:MAG: hypothetical protein Q9162_006055 [Coniocarpon cinnabarinum]